MISFEEYKEEIINILRDRNLSDSQIELLLEDSDMEYEWHNKVHPEDLVEAILF